MKVKSYTDLEQSKKLAEILPLESADLWYHPDLSDYPDYVERCIVGNIPCWSLAALYAILPEQTDISKSYSDDDEDAVVYWCWNYATDIETEEYDNPVDACVEMIIKLKESGLL